ncbi:MAG: hypothetical protein H6585_12095 [Flavobacteriales bacterium]|nr:hypothetical protein [Flavobacteriales bacterium]MCB9449071.1 hypothetical protein [Flavobacteriales bacterium]
MEYDILTCSTKEEVVGKSYPQCKGMPSGYGFTKEWFEKSNSMTKLNNNAFPNAQPELLFELEEDANLTDLLSPSNISARGLLLSQRAKEVFENSTMIEHKFYPASVKFNEKNYKYEWLHLVKGDLFGVDFSASSFQVTNLAFVKINDLKLSSYDEFLKEKSELKMKHIRASRLILDKDYAKNSYDLLMFPFIHSNIFISKRLVNQIETKGLTGFSFIKQNILS